MNNNKFTPKDIDEQTFSIPLYQRLFAWTPKEVKKLLSDLKEHFDSKQFKEKKNPYYLGMLTAIKREGGSIDLIDGQQRFTVMMLMAIAFKHLEEWQSFLHKGERLKLAARTEDENYLRNLANDDHLSNHLNMGNSYYNYENLYIKNALLCINDYIYEVFADNEARDIYARNIYNHLTFFISELPSHYLKEATSLNKYFEVLNSTGRGLEQHEILKVKLIRNQQNSDRLIRIWNAVSQMEIPIIHRDENIDDQQYAEKYRAAINECRLGHFDNALSYIKDSINDAQEDANTIDIIPVKKKESSSGFHASERQDSILSFPEFLLLSLDLTFNLDGKDGFYQKNKLIERFEEQSKKFEEQFKIFEKQSIINIDRFYNNLLFYRLLLDYYVVRRDISNGQSRFTINFRDNDRENRECLRQYLSMLSVSTEFYIWLIPYMKQLRQLPNDWQDASGILQKLKDEDNMRRCKDGYPQKLRAEKYPNIDRYWFWRLDYYLWEQRAEYFNTEDRRIVDEYVFRTNRSIEHLHPQDESYNETWSREISNGFGNLAMISQSFNSLQSNDNIRVKFARIQEQLDNKTLQSLKMLVMFRRAKEDHSKWSEQVALDHLEQMCTLLEQTVSQENVQ